ncbi:methyl-accepting chemotaxis protein [Asticcacaulis sp. 201]|uniref:methyl-accepting chemotaxis protein n=1 Tax=Asticcacaulis sp. 201 TaxID=3028787 RepID=UPI002916C671|nr:CHASE3 domain-containing protein [Asticcacaulis sp. 201]MDV6330992.1 CHASE3 domain-containing protein [Asticcacaulis sp. 201]
MLKTQKIGAKMMVMLAAIALNTLASGLVIFYMESAVDKNSRWNDHSYQVLQNADALLMSMVNQETGMRGFLITGNDANLDPYKNGKTSFDTQFATLKDLTKDNPAQQQRLDNMNEIATSWHNDVTEPAITLGRNPATQAQGQDYEKTGKGKSYMDGFRAKMAEFREAESSLLTVRSKALASSLSGIVLTIILSSLVSLGVIVAILFAVSKMIVSPITSLTGAMEKVARGEDNVKVPGAERGDEIGAMSRAFEDNARRVAAMAEAQKALEASAAEQRKIATLKLADDFEKSVGGIVTLVSSAATEMQAAASQLSATAQEASAQSVAVSSAAEEAGANVTSVASSAEELGASVAEIGRQVETSSAISSDAVREANEAVRIVAELNEVASSIGGVVDLIAGLAGQTNLLALNATIESARAGEAGKGFAVVASEVKALAGQTAKATTEISSKISQIQEATSRAAGAIQSITGTIENINQVSTTIASAVEQQSAATQEIVQAVNQASIGTQEVTSNITGVALAAEQTGEAASQVLSSSAELATQAERLNLEMDKFLTTVRAA